MSSRNEKSIEINNNVKNTLMIKLLQYHITALNLGYGYKGILLQF